MSTKCDSDCGVVIGARQVPLSILEIFENTFLMPKIKPIKLKKEVNSESSNHMLYTQYAEERLSMQSTLNLEIDGTQQRKTTLGSHSCQLRTTG